MSRETASRALVFLAGLAVWEALARSGLWSPALLPPPEAVARYLAGAVRDGSLAWGAGTSLLRLAIGYSLSVVGGVALGVVVARFRRVSDALGGVIFGLQTLPSVCWLPLAILWFNRGEPAILFVVVMGAIPTITVATWNAIQQVPPLYVRAGQTLGARGSSLYLTVVFPAAFPAMLAGFKQGWNFAWRSLMAGELLDVTRGLGFLLASGRQRNDVAQLFGVMLVIVALGAVVDFVLFRRLERAVRSRWGFV